MKEIINQYRIFIHKLIIYNQEVKLMKETKKKVVNIQEYKEKRKQKEVDRNELIALIKQIATLKQGNQLYNKIQKIKTVHKFKKICTVF